MPFNPVGYAIALAIGWFLKNKTSVSNQAIPILNFAIQFLGAVVVALVGPTPAEAGVFGFLGKAGESLLPFALEAIGNTVAATGTQSGAKATGRVAWSLFKRALLLKAVEKAAAEAEK